MKILAIRGKNLASLAGEFELLFDQEPLASTGLFAICGPTGSGKSTLLDALCLALYDETPRLTHAMGKNINLPDVGDETISPQDPRNLLRRGAGEGFAEVDFVGNDGIAYRAHWSVRRARGKAAGKLQNTEMRFQTLSGEQRLGGVKSEVLAAIQERLGLSFQQFTRAVLLAQNEFATFLKANDNERAELLETLTGLDVYSGISIRAFERAKAEQQALESIKSQLAGQHPLSAEQRAELEQGLVTARADFAALEHRKIELDQQLQWHESWEKLQQSERQALETVQKTQADQQAAADRQRQLAQIEAVQEARPLVVEIDRLIRDTEKSRLAIFSTEEQLAAARHIRQQAEDGLAKAADALALAEKNAHQAQPSLNRAKELDAEIATLIPGHAAAAKVLAEARLAASTAQEKLDAQNIERARTVEALIASQGWLATHESLRRLAEDWPRWNMLFDEATRAQKSLGETEQDSAVKQQEAQKHQRLWDEAASALTKTQTALQEAEIRLQSAIQTLASFDADELAGRRAAAEIRREQIVSGERLWNALTSSRNRQQILNEEAYLLQEKITRAETVLSQTQIDKAAAAAQLEQSEKLLRIAEAACAENVEALREHLEADLPCPVCGATDHPYATGDPPSLVMLARLKDEVDVCRKALAVLDRRETACQTQLESTRPRLAMIAGEQHALTEAIQKDLDSWSIHPVGLELSTVAPAEQVKWFATENQSVRDQFAAITVQENTRRQANKARDDAQTAHNRCQQQYSEARDALNTEQMALDQAAQAIQKVQDQQAELARQLSERLAALDTAFPEQSWRSAWWADPLAFHQQCREQTDQWNNQRKTIEQLQISLVTFDIEIKNLEASVSEQTARLYRIAEFFAEADRNLQTKRQHRQDLFDGRPSVEMEADLTKATEEAKTGLQHQDKAAKAAATQQASAEAILGQAQRVHNESQQAARDAETALEQWIARFNADHPAQHLDHPQLTALLGHDTLWLSQEREELRRLANAVRDAETTLRDRQLKCQEHEQQQPTPNPAQVVVRAEQTHTALALEQARQHVIELEIDLRRDDQRQAAAARLQDEIARQEAQAGIWQKLDALIGSANGTKFRNYAQQFTLDVLLGYANHHLTDLSRRYRLERVKDSLALMVVDQDMGDEYRSVHSLSGGESFLVSLALALGLASLSSNRVQVESLFIDEGFGSLDADTLRVAMDALDHLQAQGRKVGVISHVQDMTERIGIQIQVRRQSGGQSRIEVRGI
ncbi:MAG: AAA family ATPase [Candidatus Competibacteraceae bacterium]|nr:AAA family ATPase [Candidatus Competibacteraceae bacterium]